jgi:hypothetical protein
MSFIPPVGVTPSDSITGARLEWPEGSGFGLMKSDLVLAVRPRIAESRPYALSSAADPAGFF